jgi:hypothetical protein
MHRLSHRGATLLTLASALVICALAACEKNPSEPGSQTTKVREPAKPPSTTKELPPYAWVAGDFNGDGKTDLLWYNKGSGQVGVWLLNGTTVLRTDTLRTIPTDWQIGGVGDFNGDGKTDLLWHNKSSGQVEVWLLNGNTMLGGGTLRTVPADWQIGGVGDFNGDGKADLLWYNKSSGQVDVWFVDGPRVNSVANLGQVRKP